MKNTVMTTVMKKEKMVKRAKAVKALKEKTMNTMKSMEKREKTTMTTKMKVKRTVSSAREVMMTATKEKMQDLRKGSDEQILVYKEQKHHCFECFCVPDNHSFKIRRYLENRAVKAVVGSVYYLIN